MPRPRRAAEGGLIYHALNRANARLAIFDSDADYAAFERVLRQAVARFDMRLLAYCLMPNHFHLLLWPREDGDLSTLMRWLTMTHTQRWHAHHGTAGHRPSVPGPVQVIPGAVGRASPDGLPLRRTERPARELGPARREVEVGEPYPLVGTNHEAERPILTPWPMNVREIGPRVSTRPFGPERGGGDASQHAARSTVRFGVLAGRGSGEARSGVVAPAQRPTTTTTQQRLLPLSCLPAEPHALRSDKAEASSTRLGHRSM